MPKRRFPFTGTIRILVVILALLPGTAAAQAPTAELDAWVERARREFDVPGIAVAIVKDGQLVTARGYGVRTLGRPDAIDGDTVFGIASNTKAFTTAALSILADEGKLAWDDPVTKHLPWFAMHDPYVSREITVRDLVTHRAGLGLGGGDLLWWPPTDLTREEIARGARHLPPASSFRSRYAYNNVLFVVAGLVVDAASGRTWDDFIRTRIFGPLGMTRSNTSVTRNPTDGNVATPHALVNGKPTAIGFWNFDNVGAAASINSTARDLARWALVQLDGGRIGGVQAESGATNGSKGQRLFSERMSREMWSPQTIQRIPDPHPALAAMRPTFAAYGLGWALADYRGHELVSHGGALPGYATRVMLVPSLKLGVIVLTNQETPAAHQSLVYHVLDSYMGGPTTDWIAAYAKARAAAQTNERETLAKAAAERHANTAPSLPLDRFAGTYRDPWYGNVTVAHEGDRLVMRFSRTPLLVADLEHWHHDTFVARWRERALNADAWVTFSLQADGTVRDITMAPVSPLVDFSFDFQDLRLTRAATTEN
jgi:CubicO group peptidase (beta-lactamase class C family)